MCALKKIKASDAWGINLYSKCMHNIRYLNIKKMHDDNKNVQTNKQ